jgi:hypothetical protein
VPYVLSCRLESDRKKIVAKRERIQKSFPARLRDVLK